LLNHVRTTIFSSGKPSFPTPTQTDDLSATVPDSQLPLTRLFARLVFGFAAAAMAWFTFGAFVAILLSDATEWWLFLFCGWFYIICSFRCFGWGAVPKPLIAAGLFLNALGSIPFIADIHRPFPTSWFFLILPLMWILVIRSAILSTTAKENEPSAAADDRPDPSQPPWKTRRWELIIFGLAAVFMVGFSIIGFNAILYPVGNDPTPWGLFLLCGWFYIIGSFLSFCREKSPSRLIASAALLHGIAALGFFPLLAHTQTPLPWLWCLMILPLTWLLVILTARKVPRSPS
jgi:MFS family permease